jgi:recombination protein RecT
MPPSTAIQRVQLCDINKSPPNDQVAIATLRDLFERKQGELQKVAAKHLTPDRLAKIAINCVSKTPRLMECTPISILSSVMAAASMGLEAGGALNEGWLIPRFNGRKKLMECSFLPSYRGLITLARRSGYVLSVEADVVYENDEWTYSKTEMGTSFTHVPCENGEPGQIRLAYAVARLKDTPIPMVVVMTRRELDAIRDRDQRKGESPWDTDHAQMCLKTALRRICKFLPMSIELAECLNREADEEREVIDVTPTRAAKQERKTKSEDLISNGTHVDTSESQDAPSPMPLAEALEVIAKLKTDAECALTSERLKNEDWASDEDRKAAVVALKARWKVILDELKAAKAAVRVAADPTPPLGYCEHCGVVDGTKHPPGCPGDSPLPAIGDEIQGRNHERQMGEDG